MESSVHDASFNRYQLTGHSHQKVVNDGVSVLTVPLTDCLLFVSTLSHLHIRGKRREQLR